MLTKIVGDEAKLMILNKVDLARSCRNKEWQGISNLKESEHWLSTPKSSRQSKKVTNAAKSLMADKIAFIKGTRNSD